MALTWELEHTRCPEDSQPKHTVLLPLRGHCSFSLREMFKTPGRRKCFLMPAPCGRGSEEAQGVALGLSAGLLVPDADVGLPAIDLVGARTGHSSFHMWKAFGAQPHSLSVMLFHD